MLKKNKTKNISLILGFCAILSLASIGFSTWILTLGDGSEKLEIGIQIETVYNDAKIVEIIEGYTKTISLDTDKSQQSIDLNLSAELIISDDELNSTSTQEVSVGIEAKTDNDETNYNLVDFENIATEDIFGRDLTSTEAYTYLDVTKANYTITKDQFQKYHIDGYHSITLNFDDLGIRYGSYFNYQNPENFYSKKIEELKNQYSSTRSEVDRETYLKSMEIAKNDVSTMKEILKGKNIVITLKIK